MSSNLALATTEPTSFGSGFLSGFVSAILGIVGFGVVVALRLPEYFSFKDVRQVYGSAYLSGALHVALVAAFVLGSVSACLRVNKTLALTGIGFTLAAAMLGGSHVAAPVAGDRPAWLGVDFFVLNLMFYSAVFVPLERWFALRADQQVFRRHWPLDLTYFFINSLLIEVLTILTLRPAVVLFAWAQVESVRNAIAALPLLVQVPLLLLVADLTQYWVHRMLHSVQFLWPIHAVHHSIEEMDWLAGSRLHLADVVVTRGLTYVPIFVLGFTQRALMAYVFVVATQATFIHANVRWKFAALRRFVVTPAFHHWHHSAERQAVDKNFAVHTPIWDILFGTYYLPDRWPSTYGLADGSRVPSRFIRQFLYPLGPARARRLEL